MSAKSARPPDSAAWVSVLTYSGALLLENYAISPTAVALGLALMATAMFPGTFGARRRVTNVTPALLAGLTAFQATAVLALCTVRPVPGVTLALLGAFVRDRVSPGHAHCYAETFAAVGRPASRHASLARPRPPKLPHVPKIRRPRAAS